jgi:hypothetical protein
LVVLIGNFLSAITFCWVNPFHSPKQWTAL